MAEIVASMRLVRNPSLGGGHSLGGLRLSLTQAHAPNRCIGLPAWPGPVPRRALWDCVTDCTDICRVDSHDCMYGIGS